MQNYDERARAYMRPFGQRLLTITEDCRIDMHEPDEQDVSARVYGQHLDNAMGESITIDDGFQEYVVILRRGIAAEKFNLATLIALARIGAERINEA